MTPECFFEPPLKSTSEGANGLRSPNLDALFSTTVETPRVVGFGVGVVENRIFCMVVKSQKTTVGVTENCMAVNVGHCMLLSHSARAQLPVVLFVLCKF